jgi:restriction system protein
LNVNIIKVQVLYDKIRAIGANKGILILTSNFQIGAIKYAKEHGIALIQIVEADLTYEIRTKPNVIMMDAHKSLYNNGQPYIGIMQIGSDCGFYCKYLRNGNTNLREFLNEEKEKFYEG